MSAAPPTAATCRACAAPIDPGAARCMRCGAAQREETCPHCGGVAGASPHAELRFRCDVCGGPRVPVASSRIKRSGREIASLQTARAAASARAGWRAAAIASGALLAFELLLLAILLLALGASFGLLVAALVTMAPFTAFAFFAMRRAKARGREIAPALDAAWVAVAADVASQTEGVLTARGLATTLGVAEAQAEELLALLEVNDIVRGATSPGGEFGYAPRLRIEEQTGARDADASALAAEDEAFAAGQTASPLQRRAAYVDPTKR